MKALGWSTVLQMSRLGTNGVVFLVIAFFLEPAIIGAYFSMFAIYQIITSLTRHGFSTVIVRNSDIDNIVLGSFNTVTFVANCLLLPLFFIPYYSNSGTIDEFVLMAMTSSFAMMIVFDCITTIPEGFMRRELDFRQIAIRNLFALCFSIAIGSIALALDGPLSSLLVFSVTNSFANLLASCISTRYLPRFKVPDHRSWQFILEGFSYNVSNFLQGSLLPIIQILINSYLGAVFAGYYGIIMRILTVSASIFFEPIRQLGVPVLIRAGDNNEKSHLFSHMSANVIIRGCISCCTCGVVSFLVIGWRTDIDTSIFVIILLLPISYTLAMIYSFNFQLIYANGFHRFALLISFWYLLFSCACALFFLSQGRVLSFFVFEVLKFIPVITLQLIALNHYQILKIKEYLSRIKFSIFCGSTISLFNCVALLLMNFYLNEFKFVIGIICIIFNSVIFIFFLQRPRA